MTVPRPLTLDEAREIIASLVQRVNALEAENAVLQGGDLRLEIRDPLEESRDHHQRLLQRPGWLHAPTSLLSKLGETG